MNICLKTIKKAYDILTKEERELLIKELEEQMNKFLYRVKEKEELIKYLKEIKNDNNRKITRKCW